MESVLILGASGGIGQALVKELNLRGKTVTSLSRSTDQFDITNENSIRDAIDRLVGPFDTIIVATGALAIGSNKPEKAIKSLDPIVVAEQFALNATGPALVLKHALQHMPHDRKSVFAALSARVGSIGENRLGGWYSYRASKAALNQLIHTASIEVAKGGRTKPLSRQWRSVATDTPSITVDVDVLKKTQAEAARACK